MLLDDAILTMRNISRITHGRTRSESIPFTESAKVMNAPSSRLCVWPVQIAAILLLGIESVLPIFDASEVMYREVPSSAVMISKMLRT